MTNKILIVDDESAIANIIKFNLERESYEVDIAKDGTICLELMKNNEYDLIILDVMMPKMDGFTTLKEIRRTKNVPVIMLTAKEEEFDKVLGLELGADDYIVKPFSMRELIARIKALLRRITNAKSSENENDIIKMKNLILDVNKYEIKKDNQIINLTVREFELLKFFVMNPKKIFSREELLKEVWNYEYYGDIRTVDVTIRRLREKIEDENETEYKYILTKRGIGYYFGD